MDLNTVEAANGLLDKLGDASACPCIPTWLRYVLFIIFFIRGFIMCSNALGCTDHKTNFTILWVLGVLGAWVSSLFVMSIKKQLKHMTQSVDNIVSNIIILICFVLVIILEYTV